MHPQLSEHKTPQCAELIQRLHACHQDKPVGKYFGRCNSVKSDLTLCLRKERQARTKTNRENARAKRAQVEKIWTDYEKNN
ncbi:hypothetical protein H4R34_000042 [Dimargaris verticillata]|uniref:COX assembly mitochondrial protein n=1 Tax=Dimargaris verticillata TaxID=2761393 RepID=A0A9W8B8Y5_9FUNG|nr:hypothetical protein H4R34_000042 [Dimargaris verticillata]